MTQFWSGTTTFPAVGTYPVTCGFQPIGMEIIVSAIGLSETVNHMSIGSVDVSGFQTCDSTYSDSTGHFSKKDIGKVVRHYKRVSGTVVPVNECEFVNFTSTGVNLKVTNCTNAYQYTVKLWG